jgi:hypothetical protein
MEHKQPFGLYAIANPGDDGLEPLKAILPNDGSRGFAVGEDWEIEFLYNLLGEYLQTKQVTGQISDLDEQIGMPWLTIGEAVSLSAQYGEEISSRTIRWAASHGFIRAAQKSGRDWRFPKSSFLGWLSNRPKPGRK